MLHLFIYLYGKSSVTSMLKNYYKKYPNISYKNQLVYTIALWEPKEEK